LHQKIQPATLKTPFSAQKQPKRTIDSQCTLSGLKALNTRPQSALGCIINSVSIGLTAKECGNIEIVHILLCAVATLIQRRIAGGHGTTAQDSRPV